MADKQSPMYKKPSDKQRKSIEKARKNTREGMEGEKDILSKFSTTMAKAARDQTKQGRKDMERIPEEVRRYEAEEGQTSSTYQKGGSVENAVKSVATELKRGMASGLKKGGKVESKLMGKEGRGMAKATMQKVASKAVKAHEGRMHKAKSIDGIATKGKTRGRMV